MPPSTTTSSTTTVPSTTTTSPTTTTTTSTSTTTSTTTTSTTTTVPPGTNPYTGTFIILGTGPKVVASSGSSTISVNGDAQINSSDPDWHDGDPASFTAAGSIITGGVTDPLASLPGTERRGLARLHRR